MTSSSNKILALLADRAVWGWACVRNREFVCRPMALASDAIDALNSDGYSGFKPHPVLVVPTAIGKPLTLIITEDELADLGPCGNLP